MDHAHTAQLSATGTARRVRTLTTALVALAAAFGVLPHQGLPPAHGDENMGICIPAGPTPVLPQAGGSGAPWSYPAGAAVLFDPACGDPIGRRETAPAWAQYDSTGFPNTVEHHATGSYVVRFAGLGAGSGVPQVTAVGAAPNRCHVGGWQPDGVDEAVTVLCADAQGTPVDWEFTASYTSERTAYSGFGYLRADQPGSILTYQPALQYASSGVPVTVQRTAAGRYTVSRAESGPGTGADLVTAYGTTDGRTFCKVAGSTASTVSVACFAGATAVDSPFTLTYGLRGNLLGLPDAAQSSNGLPSGYVWADTTAGAVPDPTRRFASYDTGTGWSQSFDQQSRTARIAMPVAMSTGVPLLVAAGSDASFCAIAGDWTGGAVPVGCWNGIGEPVQAPAEVAFTGVH